MNLANVATGNTVLYKTLHGGDKGAMPSDDNGFAHGDVSPDIYSRGIIMDEHDAKQTVPTETTPAAGTSRRRLFKRLGIATLFGGLAAGLGFKAFASGHGCHGHGSFMSGDPATLDERIDRMLKHLSVEIDATPAQQQQLAPILKQAASDLLPL